VSLGNEGTEIDHLCGFGRVLQQNFLLYQKFATESIVVQKDLLVMTDEYMQCLIACRMIRGVLSSRHAHWKLRSRAQLHPVMFTQQSTADNHCAKLHSSGWPSGRALF
jgi:hypothetical protein